MSKTVFSTTDRHLENFLYYHRIRFSAQEKGADGLNEWYYVKTNDLRKCIAEYNQLYGAKYDVDEEV